ncbi:MAG: TIGR04211 family SH3 domain-containing protein [Deltaproteobacteria bacterium]|nr:TIGR04211 family SH3 domain-containing protein [Deltaproteobacteria bacterium]
MKKNYQCFLIILLWIVFFACPLLARDNYVTEITSITMRTGSGLEHKVIAMLKSGSKLEIIEYQKDWSQVRTDSGQTGWVLSRFLTEKIPDVLLVDKFSKENLNLISKLKGVEQENKKLINENVRLAQVEEKYSELKQKSAYFLKLDAEYKKISEQSETQKNQIKELENSLNSDEKLWFLSGGGVFIVGLCFGLSMRKKKKSSLL